MAQRKSPKTNLPGANLHAEGAARPRPWTVLVQHARLRAALRAVPCAAHSVWGFSDSTSLCSQKRLRHPCLAPSFHYGLLTQAPLRCSARRTGGQILSATREFRTDEIRQRFRYDREFPPVLEECIHRRLSKVRLQHVTKLPKPLVGPVRRHNAGGVNPDSPCAFRSAPAAISTAIASQSPQPLTI